MPRCLCSACWGDGAPLYQASMPGAPFPTPHTARRRRREPGLRAGCFIRTLIAPLPPVLPTTRSILPSPLRSPVAIEAGNAPAATNCCVWNEPLPLPRKTLTETVRGIGDEQVELAVAAHIGDHGRQGGTLNDAARQVGARSSITKAAVAI
jgi:hypothetical protein